MVSWERRESVFEDTKGRETWKAREREREEKRKEKECVFQPKIGEVKEKD